jgi:hypothetical protein
MKQGHFAAHPNAQPRQKGAPAPINTKSRPLQLNQEKKKNGLILYAKKQ